MMDQLKKTVDANTKDITEIKTEIQIIKNNHLHHIEKDMSKQSKQLEKMDMRLWGILILLVGSVVLGVITNGL